MPTLEELTVESIKAQANAEVRLASLELAIINMAKDHRELMTSINEIHKQLLTITLNQQHNETILREDITEIRQELDALIADHSPCKTLAKAATDNKATHQAMKRRIDDMENKCDQCPVQGFKDLSDKMEKMDKTLEMLVTSLKVVTYKVGHFPVWVIFVAMVLAGVADLTYRHKDWVTKILGW
jgi:hypothetical protein